MSHAAFAHPDWLVPLAWIFAAGALALLGAQRWARARVHRLMGQSTPSSPSALARDAALLFALAAIGLALLGPRIGDRLVRVASSGVDTVFLVDVSRSMDAADVPPTRMARARRTVNELLGRLEAGDRVALAAFGGRGLLLTPLTPDHDAVSNLVTGLTSDIIAPASSNLGDGVRAALEAYEVASERPRVMVVVSDGEDPRRRSDLAIKEALDRNVRVVTAALGSDTGSFVPDGDRVLRDESGARISTRRNTERLLRLAEGTGGSAFVADEWGRFDFTGAVAEIRRDVAPDGERATRRVAAVRTAPFAALAFMLLLVEMLPRFGRPGIRLAAGTGAVALSVPLLFAAWPPGAVSGAEPDSIALPAAEARVREEPENASARIELGLVHLAEGRSESATREFLAATVYARDPEVEAVAHYDLGVAALARGELETARESFFDALSLDPTDDAARFNLEWTLAALRSQRSEPEVQSNDSGAENPQHPDSPPRPGDASMPPSSRAATSPPEERANSLSAEQRRRLLDRAADDAPHRLRRDANSAQRNPRSGGELAW